MRQRTCRRTGSTHMNHTRCWKNAQSEQKKPHQEQKTTREGKGSYTKTGKCQKGRITAVDILGPGLQIKSKHENLNQWDPRQGKLTTKTPRQSPEQIRNRLREQMRRVPQGKHTLPPSGRDRPQYLHRRVTCIERTPNAEHYTAASLLSVLI